MFARTLIASRPIRIAALSVAMLAAAASPAAAASGQTGTHSRAQVTCDALAAKLLVHLPMVASVPVSSGNVFTVGGWTGGGSHPQLVGVRAWLLRWNAAAGRYDYTDQNGDGRYDATALFQTTVLSDGNLFGGSWYNVDARRPQAAGDTLFTIRYTGFYRVNVEYFWYADRYVGPGYDLLTSVDHFVTQYTTVSKPYCTY
jgi:hypothetical protein